MINQKANCNCCHLYLWHIILTFIILHAGCGLSHCKYSLFFYSNLLLISNPVKKTKLENEL